MQTHTTHTKINLLILLTACIYICVSTFSFFFLFAKGKKTKTSIIWIFFLSTKYAAYQHWTLGTRVSHAHTHVNTPRCNGNMEVILYTYSMEPYAPLGMQHAISCTKLMEEGKTRRCTIRRLMKSQKHSNTLRGSLWTKLCWFLYSVFVPLPRSNPSTLLT